MQKSSATEQARHPRQLHHVICIHLFRDTAGRDCSFLVHNLWLFTKFQKWAFVCNRRLPRWWIWVPWVVVYDETVHQTILAKYRLEGNSGTAIPLHLNLPSNPISYVSPSNWHYWCPLKTYQSLQAVNSKSFKCLSHRSTFTNNWGLSTCQLGREHTFLPGFWRISGGFSQSEHGRGHKLGKMMNVRWNSLVKWFYIFLKYLWWKHWSGNLFDFWMWKTHIHILKLPIQIYCWTMGIIALLWITNPYK